MKRLLDPFNSLAPARNELIVGYGLVMAGATGFAALCLFGSPGWAVSAIFAPAVYKLRQRPYTLLGLNSAATASWQDPLAARMMWAAGPLLVVNFGYFAWPIAYSKSRMSGQGFYPDHLGLALLAVVQPALSIMVNLRRLSWLAAHRTYTTEVGSDGA